MKTLEGTFSKIYDDLSCLYVSHKLLNIVSKLQALGNKNLHSRQNGGHYQDYEGKRSRKQEEKDENEQAGQSGKKNDSRGDP